MSRYLLACAEQDDTFSIPVVCIHVCLDQFVLTVCSGTLLASGSDDLHIVLWNWVRNRRALIYDSGHRSNVFQVSSPLP